MNGSPVVTQIRPDDPETGPDGELRKYLFPTGQGPVLACHPAMRERVLDATAPIVVVEGTKQYLAACTVLRGAAQGAVGIAGCWGWSSEGQPSADLEEIPWDGREVYLCFDADVRTKRNVYDAAQALTDILTARGAASVRYVLVPGAGMPGSTMHWLRCAIRWPSCSGSSPVPRPRSGALLPGPRPRAVL